MFPSLSRDYDLGRLGKDTPDVLRAELKENFISNHTPLSEADDNKLN